ncbi:type III secretion system protein PrgH/EprH [Pseudomonas sp. LAMO17WK12:I10]|uniref:PrgH/EprH family type III secretion apparatus protein n=1 Tax=unclassified Pseudomonas TaxID=196821 RepID=UPI000BC549F0|nr:MULTISPECIES: PrgH/EprH family type III secretion apparatus protein [unclassified Pseudomonas]PXX53999.1 type III secretion system PrgH/EprH family protein [Pseudomonas sp. LAMO17WK12:I9]SNY51929.1 type III secretion system protein PrgH/EprH [Pseudomonas sp. LAMO17WK12:I10]
MQDLSATSVVLKILNGPMQGCEFFLERPRTLFVVGSEAMFCVAERLATVPEDAIYIPLEREGFNFEVLLGDQVELTYDLRLFSGEEVQEKTCEFQTIQEAGGLRISVKLASEEWAQVLDLSPSPVKQYAIQSSWFDRSWRYVFAGVALLLMLGSIWLGNRLLQPNAESTVETLIAGSNSTMTVLRGRDGLVYALANSERDANWGRQVLVRNGYAATQVLTTSQERMRLEKVLDELEPQLAFHYLDFSDPASPRLLVSNQRTLLTLDLRTRLESELLKATPYASAFYVQGSDDEEFELKAEQGLKRLGIPFMLQRNTDSVNFSVAGSFDDTELYALTDYIERFQQQWGARYVYFSVELKDDWLKGKSFQYGSQSYIKMTPASWYFPPPMQ